MPYDTSELLYTTSLFHNQYFWVNNKLKDNRYFSGKMINVLDK